MLQYISAHCITYCNGHCYLVSLKATNNYIINNHKVTDFTTICGIYGLKTVKIAQNPKFRFS